MESSGDPWWVEATLRYFASFSSQDIDFLGDNLGSIRRSASDCARGGWKGLFQSFAADQLLRRSIRRKRQDSNLFDTMVDKEKAGSCSGESARMHSRRKRSYPPR
jgi:hypothetical protein